MRELLLINILCTWEFSGSPLSWAWCSHSGGPGPTPDMEIKNPQAIQHSQRKKKTKEKNTDKENPRLITNQTEINKNNTKKENRPNPTQMIKKKKETRKQTKNKKPPTNKLKNEASQYILN